MKTYSVYWIRALHHNDPFTEGYIGISVQPKKRFRQHKAGYAKSKVSDALKKYENAEMLVLHENLSQENAKKKEIEYRPDKNIGWNLESGGGIPPDCTGLKYTQERLEKISGKNNYFYGKSHSDETKRKLSESKRGENNPFYGKKRPEHSAKMKKFRAENNPNFRGWFITPNGKFASYKEAIEKTGSICTASLYRWCINENETTITIRSYAGSSYLKTNYGKEIIGKTYKEIGFDFEPVKNLGD